MAPKKLGGLGDVKKATHEIQEICDKVKSQVAAEVGENFSHFTAVEYAEQVVSGKNYFIKVDVGCHEFLLIRVYVDLNQHTSFVNYQKCKSKECPVTYFE